MTQSMIEETETGVFLHLCLVDVLCNDMVMHATSPCYLSDLKDTVHEKESHK